MAETPQSWIKASIARSAAISDKRRVAFRSTSAVPSRVAGGGESCTVVCVMITSLLRQGDVAGLLDHLLADVRHDPFEVLLRVLARLAGRVHVERARDGVGLVEHRRDRR